MLIDIHHHLPPEEVCPYIGEYLETLQEVAEKFSVDYYCVSVVGPSRQKQTNDDVEELIFGDTAAKLLGLDES